MKMDAAGIALLIDLEGTRLEAYKDSGGVWTIGNGITRLNGKLVKKGDKITKAENTKLFHATVAIFEVGVLNALEDTKVNQHQLNALICLAYNIGMNAFRHSRVLAAVKADPNNREAIEPLWLEWCKDNGKFVQGLLNRRKKELDLYFT